MQFATDCKSLELLQEVERVGGSAAFKNTKMVHYYKTKFTNKLTVFNDCSPWIQMKKSNKRYDDITT